MTREELLEALHSGETVCVKNIWYFTRCYMSCADEHCCQNNYDTIEETAEAAMAFGGLDEMEVL